MNKTLDRRSFLKTSAAATAMVGMADAALFSSLAPVSAAEARLPVGQVQFAPEIEPLVRLLEETPRDRVLEEYAQRIRKGTTYREVLAALLLAGVRNIQPRPVGFKFHAVLVVNSAHLASLNSPDSDRWFPIFWALDQFKSSQARDEREGNWTMSAVEEKAVPPAHRAKEAFVQAMDGWDVGATDVAVAGLARTCAAQEVFELFARYGARDFRDIGHKAIYTANSWRTLENIGWQHAEPVLRSLAYALLEHEEGNPATRDAKADAPGRRNDTLIEKIRPDWMAGKNDPEATRAFIGTLRQADEADVADSAVTLLNDGIGPRALWDAIFNAGSELLMRQPGIVALHSLTTANAMHYIWQHTARDQTRCWLLLQAAAFMSLFRQRIGPANGEGIQLEAKPPQASGPEGAAEVFSQLSRDRQAAARLALGYLDSGNSPVDFINTARRLIYLKGTDSHDYKFSEAALEDYFHLTPVWRNRFLAASVFNLRGSGAEDNRLVARTREALKV